MIARILAIIAVCLSVVPAYGAAQHGHSSNRFAPLWSRNQDLTLYNLQIANNVRIGNNLIRTSSGALLSFAEIRNSTNDANCFAIAVRISYDRGNTWTKAYEILKANPPTSSSTVRLAMGAAYELSDGTVEIMATYWSGWSATNGGAASTGLKIVYVQSSGTDYTTWPDGGSVTGTGGTDITSSVVKVDNTGPPAVPTTLDTTNAAWTYLLPTSAVTLSNGNVLIGAVARYAGADTSWFVVLRRTAAGVYSILGAPEESTAGNQNMNESALAACRSGGVVMAVLRDRTGGAIKFSKSLDSGVTWTDAATTSITADASNGVQPALCSDPDDQTHLLMASVEDDIRANMTVWDVAVSATGVPTFSGNKRIVFDGRAGYPGIACFGTNDIVVAYESTNDYAGYSHAYQYIKLARLSVADLAADDSPIWLQFNEKSSGAMIAGPSVFSRGMDVRGFGNTGWTYTSAGVSADGTNGITLDPARSGSSKRTAYACRSDSFTFEVVGDFTNVSGGGATQQIAGDRSTGAGWGLTVAASTGVVTFTLSDGTFSPTATHTTDIRTGVHSIVVQRNTTADTIQVYIDGVAGTAANDTTTGSMLNTNNAVLGSRPDGTTNKVASGVVFYQSRFTRGVVSSTDFLTSSTTKIPFRTLAGGYAPPSTLPSGDAECVCWIGSFADGGTNISGDIGGALAPMDRKPTTGVIGARDPISSLFFVAPSASRNALIHYDSYVGWHINYPRVSSTSNPAWACGNGNTTFEFIPETGAFTIIFGAVRFQTTTGAQEILFDTRNSTASNPGITFRRESDKKIYATVSEEDDGIVLNGNTTDTFTETVWYTIAVTASGSGSTAKCFYAAWPGGRRVPTDLTEASFGAVAVPDGAATQQASTAPMIGARSNSFSNTADIDFKEFMVFNNGMTEAEIIAAIQHVTFEPTDKNLAPKKIGGGVGLGVGGF